jgi:protoporphyrinogen oxidase
MKIAILGAGLSGVAAAYFLQEKSFVSHIDILEKEPVIGGLCRSFDFAGISYDIGPHVIFSKDGEILKLMTERLGENVSKIRRSNKIHYKNRLIKYPFENELSALPDEERAYCLRTFLNNVHKECATQNLYQFFLKTFGEGITCLYLQPYNEKIWKSDLRELDDLIAGRIPRPPREDVLKGALGLPTEGYLHQLYFYYPRRGGIKSLIDAFVARFNEKVRVISGVNIRRIRKHPRRWEVETAEGEKRYDRLISTIPLPSLAGYCHPSVPQKVREAVSQLKYNSILIAVLSLKRDRLGGHFAVMVPDRNVLFHRVTKLNFLGEAYRPRDGSSILMAEITYPPQSALDRMPDDDAQKEIIRGLLELRFVEDDRHIQAMEIKRFQYAYVVCDLQYRRNIECVRNYFGALGIFLCGRFGEFEYLNMDAVVRRAKNLSENLQE